MSDREQPNKSMAITALNNGMFEAAVGVYSKVFPDIVQAAEWAETILFEVYLDGDFS